MGDCFRNGRAYDYKCCVLTADAAGEGLASKCTKTWASVLIKIKDRAHDAGHLGCKSLFREVIMGFRWNRKE